MSLAVSDFTQHLHQFIKHTHSESVGVERSADHILLANLSAHVYLGRILGYGHFRAVSPDLSHMSIYAGMGVISVWILLRAAYGTVSNKNK